MPTYSIRGKTCFYQDLGTGYPILFGHSYLWTSAMWEPQLKTLSQTYRCIAVDLWDHSRSDHLGAKSYSLEQLADDYWHLMQHLQIEEFGVVGLSVGGMWGAHLALKYPEAVKTLVLMDTFLGNEPLVTKQKYFGMLDAIENSQQFSAPLLNAIVPLFFSPTTLSSNPQLVDQFRASLAATKKENIPGITALGRAIFSRQCLLDRLPDICQPTLVVVGKDDIPRPPKEAEEMAYRLPHSELQIIERAGHISNLEQPETITALLQKFLKQHLSTAAMVG